MILHASRTRRAALIGGQLLALTLLIASNRALFAPTGAVTKAQDSKRPKTPKNVVRAEPVRVPASEKPGQDPTLARMDAVAMDVDTVSSLMPLPRKAFTQLTKPEYLKSDSPGSPQIPLSPPV